MVSCCAPAQICGCVVALFFHILPNVLNGQGVFIEKVLCACACVCMWYGFVLCVCCTPPPHSVKFSSANAVFVPVGGWKNKTKACCNEFGGDTLDYVSVKITHQQVQNTCTNLITI